MNLLRKALLWKFPLSLIPEWAHNSNIDHPDTLNEPENQERNTKTQNYRQMKFSTFKSIFPLIENDTQEDASFSTHGLSTLVEELKKSNYSSKRKHNSIIFFKSHEKQVLLTAFREGVKLNSFQSNDSMTFQIMEGKIMFHTPKESFSIEKGQLMKLRENISYSITAHEDSLLLLTILTGKKNNNPANSSSFQDQNYGKQYEFN